MLQSNAVSNLNIIEFLREMEKRASEVELEKAKKFAKLTEFRGYVS